MKNNILIDGQLYDGDTGELINEVEQVEVELIENDLPAIICNGGTHIKTNTEQLKRELLIYLEKYNVEVTEDTEKDCSKMATELNKLSTNLDKKRKETSSIIKKPADDLKVSIDELISIIQEKRANILNGVEVFKQKRFELIRQLLKTKIEELYSLNNVGSKYQVCNVETLVVEGSLSKISLSKSAVDSLELMVMKVKKLEDEVTIREMQLALKCDNAGLITPIELDEVQNIIEDSDYNEKLEAMINKRLDLQEQVKKQIEQEEQRKQQLLQEQENKKQFEEQQKETGKKIVKIIATFEVEVGIDVNDLKVLSKYQEKLANEYSTLKSVAKA